jgi:uncharacterized membrane protein
MTSKTLRNWTAVIAVLLAVVMGWSITANNFVVPLIAIMLAISLTIALRRRTKEVTKDERTTLLYQKAAVATISLCVPVIALVGVSLLAFRERVSAELVSTGYVLAYAACGMLLVHSAFYFYYARKH